MSLKFVWEGIIKSNKIESLLRSHLITLTRVSVCLHKLSIMFSVFIHVVAYIRMSILPNNIPLHVISHFIYSLTS